LSETIYELFRLGNTLEQENFARPAEGGDFNSSDCEGVAKVWEYETRTKEANPKIKVHFTGALTGARANVFITPRKDGPAPVKMRFHELKEAPAGKVFVLWAVSPDNKFVKLGQIVNTGKRNEAEIQAETTIPDFGLLVTMEDATGIGERPIGVRVGDIEIIR
jgi:hypothetical protein